MSVPTARAPADGNSPPNHLCLHSYPTTSLSLPSFLLPKSPHLLTSISLPLYLFLSAISIPLPFTPTTSPPLSLPFHISTLLLSLCLLTFISFYLCPLLPYPAPLPLYPHRTLYPPPLPFYSFILLSLFTLLPLYLYPSFYPSSPFSLFPQSLSSSLCPLSPTSHRASSYRET